MTLSHRLLASALCLLPLSAHAGGYICEMDRECVNSTECETVQQRSFINDADGDFVLEFEGGQINLIPIAGDDTNNWQHFYAVVQGGNLFSVVLSASGSAIFTTHLGSFEGANIISSYGTCSQVG